MKSIILSAAVMALLSGSEAVKVNAQGGPDVFGPNGQDYSNDSAAYDLSRIGIDIIEKGPEVEEEKKADVHSHDKKKKEPKKVKTCSVGDWTTVHWTGSLTDGRVITSSREEPGGEPKTFALGASEVFKCWDLAIPQLRKGDKAKLSCPSYYVYGGAFTNAPVGGEPVPLHSDVNFEIEIVDCNRTPEFTEQVKQPQTTTLQPKQCFYFHLEKSEGTNLDLVLSADDEDWGWWWPAKYAKIEHKVVDDESQMWIQDDDGALYNAACPNYFLDQDYGHVMVADVGSKEKGVHESFPKQKRKWFFDSENHTLTTDVDGVRSELAIKGQPKNWAYAELAPTAFMAGQNENKSKWRFEYCHNKNYGPHGAEYYAGVEHGGSLPADLP